MNGDNSNFQRNVDLIGFEHKRIVRVGLIISTVLGLSWATVLHYNNDRTTKDLNKELNEVRKVIANQEIKMAEIDAKTFRESKIQMQNENLGVKQVTETQYKMLSTIYQSKITDDLTKKIIRDIMSDSIVTVSEFSLHSTLFNSSIEKINQDKVKSELIKTLSK